MTDVISGVNGQAEITLCVWMAVAVLVLFNLEKVPELIRGIRQGFDDWRDGEG